MQQNQNDGISRRQFLGYSGIAGGVATAVLGCGLRAESVEELEQKVAKYTIERGTNITDRFKKFAEKDGEPVLPVDFYEGFIPFKDPFLKPMRVLVHKPRTQNEKPYLSRLSGILDPSDIDNNTYERLVDMGYLKDETFISNKNFFHKIIRVKSRINLDFHPPLPDPLPDSYKSVIKNPDETLHRTFFINNRGYDLRGSGLTMERREGQREVIKNLYADILGKIVKFYETNAPKAVDKESSLK